MNLKELSDEIHKINVANGWYDDDWTFGDLIALLHSEVSEALEAYRDHGFKDATDYAGHFERSATEPWLKGIPPKPEGVGSELADVLIRLLHTADRCEIDLEAETLRKLAYNRTRGYRHGGKRL